MDFCVYANIAIFMIYFYSAYWSKSVEILDVLLHFFAFLPMAISCAFAIGRLKKNPELINYVGGIFVFCLGVGIFVLDDLGMINSNFYTENAIQIGSLAEVFLLSIMLSRKDALKHKRLLTAQQNLVREEQRRLLVEKENKNEILKITSSFSDELNSPLMALKNIKEHFSRSLDSNSHKPNFNKLKNHIELMESPLEKITMISRELERMREISNTEATSVLIDRKPINDPLNINKPSQSA